MMGMGKIYYVANREKTLARLDRPIKLLFSHPLILSLCIFSFSVTHAISAYAEAPDIFTITPGLAINTSADSLLLIANKTANPQTQLLEDPPRLVIDVSRYSFPRPVLKSFPENPTFKTIRAAAHEGFARIVVDLRSPQTQSPTISSGPKGLWITFNHLTEPQSSAEESHSGTVARESPVKIFQNEPVTPTPSVLTAVEKNEQLSTIESAPRVETKQLTDATPIATIAVPTPASVEKVELRFSVSEQIINLPYTARPIHDVTVKNRSKAPLFMTVLPEQIDNPGLSSELRNTTKSLLVSPRRFELAPGAERAVRLVLVSRDVDLETVYRINFIPDTEPFKVQKIGSLHPTITAGIAALALSAPKIPKAELVPSWEKDAIILFNKGNANIFLDRIRVCNAQNCKDLPAKRIYAKAGWKIVASDIETIQFVQKVGEDFEKVVLKKNELSSSPQDDKA